LNEPVPEYGAVPPVAVTSTEVEPPKHAIVPAADAEATNCVGSVIVIVVVAEQPLASVTV
jgi:hypothetical protein